MKIVIYQFILFFLVGLTIVACKKDSSYDDNNRNSNATEVNAGVNDTSLNFYEFPSPLGISITWDTQILYGIGYDSLDLDSNGTYDLFIHIHALNQDSLHLLNGLPNPFPSIVLYPQNGLEIAIYGESYYIGLGQTNTAFFVDRLDFNERIDLISDWQIGDIKMWSENPGGEGTPPFGDWYYASSENYIAIKMNANKYGWIEIDASDPKDLKFISCAIQKN